MKSKVGFDDNTGEYYITIPEDILEDIVWEPGDTVEWEEGEGPYLMVSIL